MNLIQELPRFPVIYDRGHSKLECRVRIYEIYRPKPSQPRKLVLITELADNPGKSITNAAEAIVTRIWQTCPLGSEQPIYIEHYSRIPATGRNKPIIDRFARIIPIWNNRAQAIDVSWEPFTIEALIKLIRDDPREAQPIPQEA